MKRKEMRIMSTIALKGKNYMVQEKKSILSQMAEAYKENRTEIVCGILMLSGNTYGAMRLYNMLKK